MGALVLLVVGVVGFPMLFETQPRPLPLDIPIQVPVAEGRAPTMTPQPRSPLPVINLPSDAGTEASVAEVASMTPVPVKARAVEGTASATSGVAPEPRKVASAPLPTPALAKVLAAGPSAPAAAAKASVPVVAAATPAPDAASRAADTRPATASPAAAAAASAAPSEGRYVVQVGAYTDVATLRAARAKVEKLGLKTYTQVIEADAGKRTRVRLGPYATRAEADAAAAKLKGAGLPANVLAL